MRPMLVLLGIALMVLTGCGGGESQESAEQPPTDSPTPAEQNEAAIEEAQATADTEAELRKEVLRKLAAGVELYDERGFRNSFDVPSGTCFLDEVFPAEEDPGDVNEYSKLLSPDGRGGIVLGSYEGTQEAECLTAAQEALGW